MVAPRSLTVGDRMLVCSDGVTDFLSDDELVATMTLDVADAADRIVAESLRRGSHDKVTCVVADVIDQPWNRPWGQLAGAGWDPTNLINGAAVRSRAVVDSSVCSPSTELESCIRFSMQG